MKKLKIQNGEKKEKWDRNEFKMAAAAGGSEERDVGIYFYNVFARQGFIICCMHKMPKPRLMPAERIAAKTLAALRERERRAALHLKYEELFALVPEEYKRKNPAKCKCSALNKRMKKKCKCKTSYLELLEGTIDYIEDLTKVVKEDLGIKKPKIKHVPLPPQHYGNSHLPGDSTGYKRPEKRCRVYACPARKDAGENVNSEEKKRGYADSCDLGVERVRTTARQQRRRQENPIDRVYGRVRLHSRSSDGKGGVGVKTRGCDQAERRVEGSFGREAAGRVERELKNWKSWTHKIEFCIIYMLPRISDALLLLFPKNTSF